MSGGQFQAKNPTFIGKNIEDSYYCFFFMLSRKKRKKIGWRVLRDTNGQQKSRRVRVNYFECMLNQVTPNTKMQANIILKKYMISYHSLGYIWWPWKGPICLFNSNLFYALVSAAFSDFLGRRTDWMLGRTPPCIMVTPARSLFSSSSFRMASCRWRGMILVFLLSRAAFPANSRISAARYSRQVHQPQLAEHSFLF